MKKLLDEGRLPAHVDPSVILNAPPSKRPRDSNREAVGLDGADAVESAVDGSGGNDGSDLHGDGRATQDSSKKRRRRKAQDEDSETEVSSLGEDAILSDDTDSRVSDRVRSSSPEPQDDDDVEGQYII